MLALTQGLANFCVVFKDLSTSSSLSTATTSSTSTSALSKTSSKDLENLQQTAEKLGHIAIMKDANTRNQVENGSTISTLTEDVVKNLETVKLSLKKASREKQDINVQ